MCVKIIPSLLLFSLFETTLELISYLTIDIVVLRELSELAPWPAAEHVAAERYPYRICKVVFHFGVQQVVSVRKAVEREEGESQCLMNHELRESHRSKLMKTLLLRETGREILNIG